MCGLVGFASKGGKPDLSYLAELAALAAARGPDSFGLVWTADGTSWTSHVARGAFDGRLPEAAGRAVAAVGHCRLATTGGDPSQGQPLRTGKGWIAHNGNVPNHRQVARRRKLATFTDCDSEVLGLLADGDGPLLKRLKAAAKVASRPLALLGLWPGYLAALADGQPLFVVSRAEGDYLCSLDPGGAERLEGGREWRLATPRRRHPLDEVRWVHRSTLRANAYNPNKVARPELQLLKISILEDGWTQPIVARPDGEIIDGFHRYTVSEDPEISPDGMVPVVFVQPKSGEDQMMATIRHNRARGQHGVLPMAEIVRGLLEGGKSREEVMHLLQMESEEVDRLAERAGMPARVARTKADFNAGWVPG